MSSFRFWVSVLMFVSISLTFEIRAENWEDISSRAVFWRALRASDSRDVKLGSVGIGDVVGISRAAWL